MAVYLRWANRGDQLADKRTDKVQIRHDLVRAYADPLLDAVTGLFYRLDEIVAKKNGEYLHADAPKVTFHEYKRISTLYRIAALLGWMRAVKRERSSLDPQQLQSSDETALLYAIETALADGDHVEKQRVKELSTLWGTPDVDNEKMGYVASKIDVARATYLSKRNVLSAADLSREDKQQLAKLCADIVTSYGDRAIDEHRVIETAEAASVIFGIKEAYLYRDWQVAIGDMMLREEHGSVRRYGIIGYGEFEDRYLIAQQSVTTVDSRWFSRLEAIVHDLRMERADFADARRNQLTKLHESVRQLKEALEKKIALLKQTVAQ